MATHPERRAVDSEPEMAVAPATTIGIGCWIGPGADGLAAALAAEGPDGADSLDIALGWRLVAVGGERRATAGAWAARAAAVECASLRELARVPAAMRLLLGRDMPADADLDVLLEGDAIVLGTAPLPATAVDAYRIGDRRTRLRTVPLCRWSDAFRVAQPLVEEFLGEGPATTIAVRMRVPADDAHLLGLDSMLQDACDVTLELTSGIESVWAIDRAPTVPREARGFAALARATDGALVSLDLAEAGGWERGVELIGPSGRLLIADQGIERRDRNGQLLEEIRRSGPTGAIPACLESLRTLARLRGGREEPGRQIARLAFADAARLSARTGNAESPASVEAIAARP